MNLSMRGDERKFQCFLHAGGVQGERRGDLSLEDCAGKLVTRKSVLNAEMRSCQKAWDEADNYAGWPEIISEEEL